MLSRRCARGRPGRHGQLGLRFGQLGLRFGRPRTAVMPVGRAAGQDDLVAAIHHESLSTIMAMPWPPPTHMVSRPIA